MANVQTIKVVISAGSATSGLQQVTQAVQNTGNAANKANKELESINKTLEFMKGIFAAITLDKLVDGFKSLIESAANFQDISDKTGVAASTLSKFQDAAATSGVSLNELGGLMNKLSLNMVTTSDESSKVAQGLKAIGISFDEFKKLSPEERFKAIATGLDKFEDGAGKSAAAMMILGKSGADALPFFKDLAEQIEATGGNLREYLTEDQIALADEFSKKQAATANEMKRLGEITAIQLTPAINVFSKAINETIKQVIGMDKAGKDLANDNGVEEFGIAAAQVLGVVVDAGQFVSRVLQSIGTSIGAVAAMAVAAVDRNWAGIKEINSQADKDLKKIWENPYFSDNLKKQIDAYRKAKTEMTTPDAGPKKPVLDVQWIDPAVAERAKREFEKIKGQLDALVGKVDYAANAQREYNNQIELLAKVSAMSDEQLKKLGITREQITNYQERALVTYKKNVDLIGEGTKAIDREMASLKENKFEREANQAALEMEAKLREKNITFTDAEIQSYKAKVQALKDAQRQEAFNEGQKERITALGDEVTLLSYLGSARTRESVRLNAQRAAEKAGIKDVAGATNEYIKAYDDMTAAVRGYNSVMANGAKEALVSYIEKARDVASSARDAVTTVLSSLEDRLASFFSTGKFGIKDFVTTINQELSRIAARQLLGTLTEAFTGSSLASSIFGGFRAGGGDVETGKAYVVGENEPEVFVPKTAGSILNGAQLRSLMGDSRSSLSSNQMMAAQTAITNNQSSQNVTIAPVIDMTGLVIGGGILNTKEDLVNFANSLQKKVMTAVKAGQGYGGVTETK